MLKKQLGMLLIISLLSTMVLSATVVVLVVVSASSQIMATINTQLIQIDNDAKTLHAANERSIRNLTEFLQNHRSNVMIVNNARSDIRFVEPVEMDQVNSPVRLRTEGEVRNDPLFNRLVVDQTAGGFVARVRANPEIVRQNIRESFARRRAEVRAIKIDNSNSDAGGTVNIAVNQRRGGAGDGGDVGDGGDAGDEEDTDGVGGKTVTPPTVQLTLTEDQVDALEQRALNNLDASGDTGALVLVQPDSDDLNTSPDQLLRDQVRLEVTQTPTNYAVNGTEARYTFDFVTEICTPGTEDDRICSRETSTRTVVRSCPVLRGGIQTAPLTLEQIRTLRSDATLGVADIYPDLFCAGECLGGQFFDLTSGGCADCDMDGCEECSDGSSCDRCQRPDEDPEGRGWFIEPLDGGGSRCVRCNDRNICPDGIQQIACTDNNCVQCSNSNPAVCQRCDPRFYIVNGACIACMEHATCNGVEANCNNLRVPAADGSFTCKDCPPKAACTSDSTTYSCQGVTSGPALIDSGNLDQGCVCPPGSIEEPVSNNCILDCPTGTVRDSGLGQEVPDKPGCRCPDTNQIWDGIHKGTPADPECFACPIGASANGSGAKGPSGTWYQDCKCDDSRGKWYYQDGKAGCEVCPAGTSPTGAGNSIDSGTEMCVCQCSMHSIGAGCENGEFTVAKNGQDCGIVCIRSNSTGVSLGTKMEGVSNCRCNNSGEFWHSGKCMTCPSGTSVSGKGGDTGTGCKCKSIREAWDSSTKECQLCPPYSSPQGTGKTVNKKYSGFIKQNYYDIGCKCYKPEYVLKDWQTEEKTNPDFEYMCACPEGQFIQSKSDAEDINISCKRCSNGCASCSSDSSCDRCVSNYVKEFGSNSCTECSQIDTAGNGCEECEQYNAGTYNRPIRCVKPKRGYYIADDQDKAGNYTPGKAYSCDWDGRDDIWPGGNCKKCHIRCWNAWGVDKCRPWCDDCPGGQIHDGWCKGSDPFFNP
jgi:hypothetical protein